MDFIQLLEKPIQDYGYHSIVVRSDNLNSIVHKIENKRLLVFALIDRASDTSPIFIRLQSLLHESGIAIIDPIEQLRWVSDKATLHLEFLSVDIPTPYTLIDDALIDLFGLITIPKLIKHWILEPDMLVKQMATASVDSTLHNTQSVINSPP